jgi:hypothetical protein
VENGRVSVAKNHLQFIIMKGQNMINGLDIERFRTTMAAIENDHTKGKAALRADSRWVSGTKN